MKQVTKNSVVYWSKVIVLGVILGTGLQFAQAWTEPTLAPPGGNVPGPLTVGGDGQTKEGSLALNTNGVAENALLIPSGKVGIGMIQPVVDLDVAGKIQSASTQDIDPGNTVVTKDYVENNTVTTPPDCDGDNYLQWNNATGWQCNEPGSEGGGSSSGSSSCTYKWESSYYYAVTKEGVTSTLPECHNGIKNKRIVDYSRSVNLENRCPSGVCGNGECKISTSNGGFSCTNDVFRTRVNRCVCK